MVAKRSRNCHAKSAKIAANKWLDLPIGPLAQIFSNLNPIDMLLVVPLVCKDWGRIVCEILFLQKNNLLDFSPLLQEPFWINFLWGDGAMKLMKLLVGVMHAFASNGESYVGTRAVMATPIVDIVFPRGLPFEDRHLVYIAERCPELKSIILPCAEHITGEGIARAMQFWTGMEEMTYGPFPYPRLYYLRFSKIFEEIGINCKSLQFLELECFHLDLQEADIIVRNLKSLKSLSLSDIYVYKNGLQILLSRCKNLDRVKLYYSFFIKAGTDVSTGEINIMRIRRTKWGTDKYPDKNGKLYTSKELVDLLWN